MKAQGQPEQARRTVPGTNGAEVDGSRKRRKQEAEDDKPRRVKEGDYHDDDRNGRTGPHAAMPPRKKAMRSVVVAVQ